MKNRYLILVLSTLLAVGVANYSIESYNIGEDYTIKFSTGKAEGNFQSLSGTVNFNPADLPNSNMEVSVNVNTIETGNSKKDSHAKGKKWFHAEKYPKMSFSSTAIVKLGTGYMVSGDLTIKDVTMKEKISFSYENEPNGYYLNGVLKVNRKDYNIKGNLFGFAVGKEVDISLRIPADFNN